MFSKKCHPSLKGKRIKKTLQSTNNLKDYQQLKIIFNLTITKKN